jgi:hypothetical protein
MLMTIRNLILFALVLSVTTGAEAQQRPLVTEDPETIGAGRVLLEGGVSFDNTIKNFANGLEGDIEHIATLGISIGAGAIAELQIDGGFYQNLDVNRRFKAPLENMSLLLPGDSEASLEDLVVATKVRVASETASRPALGVRLGAKLPAAEPDKGIGLGTTDVFASFLIAKTVRSVRTVGNVGVVVLGDPQDAQDPLSALTFGASIARALTNSFEMVGEFNGRLPPFAEFTPAGLESRAVFRLAGRYTYRMLRIDAGILAGFTERDPTFGFTAGATYVISGSSTP